MKKIEIKAGTWGESSPSSVQINGEIKFEASRWTELGGLQEPIVIRQFEGVNDLSPFAIQDSYAIRNKNITTSQFPALAVRKGARVVKKFTNQISGIAVWGTGTEAQLHVIAGMQWNRMINGQVWDVLPATLTSMIANFTFTTFQGNFAKYNLLATDGKDLRKYDGTTVSTIANMPANSNYVTTHDNRVYTAYNSTVYFSSLRKAEDWTTVNDAGQIVVETGNEERITGLVANSGRLTVFKQNSIHELYGNSPTNYQMKMVTNTLGTPTGKSVQIIDGIMYFLGNDGVYRYSGGNMPEGDFSLPVRNLIKNMNKKGSNYSWTLGNRYYLAVTTKKGFFDYLPDTVLEYDTEFNTWNIWEFPNLITTSGVVMNDVCYIGCSDGTIYALDDSQTKDGTTDVAFEWVSKPFTFGTMAAKTRWYRMWVVADIPTDATLNVHVSTEEDGENWTLVQSITPNSNVQAKEIKIPTTLLQNANWVRIRLEGKGQVVVHELSRQERVLNFGHS